MTTTTTLPTLRQWAANVQESEPLSVSDPRRGWLVAPWVLPAVATDWDRAVWDAQLSVVDSVEGWADASELLIGGVCVLLVRPGSVCAGVVRV